MLTEIGADKAAFIVRLVGPIRGSSPELTPDTVLAAATASGFYPQRLPGAHYADIDLDLRGVSEPTNQWQFGQQAELVCGLADRIHDGVRRQAIQRVAVFAFGRIPLLVQLGASLDDKLDTRIFQRHRIDGGNAWLWLSDETRAAFATAKLQEGTDRQLVAIVLSLSGSIELGDLPEEVSRAYTVYEVRPLGQQGPNLIASPGDLAVLEGHLRNLFAMVEDLHGKIDVIAVFPAIGVASAVTLGRVLMPEVSPALIMFERDDDRRILSSPGGPTVRFASDFETFLSDKVNLNQTRVDNLQSRVNAIDGFLSSSSLRDIFIDLIPAGSWAHRTIIKPVAANDTFDADVLLFLQEQTGWDAKDYLANVHAAFKANGTYSGMVGRKPKTRCVRVNYADEFHIDVVPYMERHDSNYITNRLEPPETGCFELSNPEAFTQSVDDRQRITNGYFIKVVRLMKYLRDYKSTFSCKSIILKTLLGQGVNDIDVIVNPDCYSDLPTALKTIVRKLADSLPATMPAVMDPGGTGDNFTDRYRDDWNYENFNQCIITYADKIDSAHKEPDRGIRPYCGARSSATSSSRPLHLPRAQRQCSARPNRGRARNLSTSSRSRSRSSGQPSTGSSSRDV